MIEIKEFKETNKEFKELARVDNLVNHDFIAHPDDDKSYVWDEDAYQADNNNGWVERE